MKLTTLIAPSLMLASLGSANAQVRTMTKADVPAVSSMIGLARAVGGHCPYVTYQEDYAKTPFGDGRCDACPDRG